MSRSEDHVLAQGDSAESPPWLGAGKTMTTYTSEPGSRLGGRYRLEDRIAAGSGWAAWKAIDEILARAVTVFTFATGFPRVSDVVTAARAASRLTDPRLAQVFDVEDAPDEAYVVMEWAAGETLSDMLSHGPLESARAAHVIAEAAGALTAAHAAGVAHMCLSPGSVRWSPTGEVKVVGLGIDAALVGASADDPVLADTRGLGRLLYAALTGYWPGSELPMLPQAPEADGEPRSPRQVVAGVPTALSDLTCRAMNLRSGSAEPPLTTPDELARALVATMPTGPLLTEPVPSSWQAEYAPVAERWDADGPPTGLGDYGWNDAGPDSDWPASDRNGWSDHGGGARDRYDGRNAGYPDAGYSDAGYSDAGYSDADGADGWPATPGTVGWPPVDRSARDGAADRPRTRTRMPVIITAGVAVLVLLVAAVVTLLPSHSSPQATGGGAPTGNPTQQASKVITLQPVGASGFDPLGSYQSDPQNENSSLAPLAIDHSLKTYWNTQWYKSPTFGGLKAGSGLIINMGKRVRFTQVTVTFGSEPGADVRLLVGNSAARSKANLDSMTTVASGTDVTGAATFTIKSRVTGQYLVIWFTRLPPKPGSSTWYMGQVFNVTVNGYS
ncbi:MAG: protein kinase family protein [Streptosporangiaceae bacterium]